MMTLTRSLSAALCTVLGAGLTVASAQQTATPAASATPAVSFQATSAQPLTYSSSSADNQVTMTENPFDKFLASNSTQPPPRRSYGKPRYRGGNTNADGSNKWAFEVAGGASVPVGNTHKYTNLSYGFSVGGGRNFNKNFGVLLEYDYDRFGFNAATISNQTSLYNYILAAYGTTYNVNGLDGNTHIHSISVNPTFTIAGDQGAGAYFSIGAGFYHKVADFTVPSTGTYCDPYYGYCYQYSANQIIDHYFSNAPGFSAGFGVTYKMGRWSSAKWFAEAKYVYMVTSQRTGITNQTKNLSNYTALNDFPANSNRTSYMPVKFGIRF